MLTYVLALCVLRVFAGDGFDDTYDGGYRDRGYDDRGRDNDRPSLADTAKDGKCVPQKSHEQICNFDAHDCFVYGDMCRWEINEKAKADDKKDDLTKDLDKSGKTNELDKNQQQQPTTTAAAAKETTPQATEQAPQKAEELELAAAVPVAPSQCAPTENITLYALALVGACSIASKTFFGLRGLTHSHSVVTNYEPMMEDF